MIHDVGVLIEGIRECFRIRPVAVSEARVIWRDQVIAIGKPCEERLEHSRRRGQSMEQENRRGILRSRFPIKNRESVNLHSAIKDLLRHRYLDPFSAFEMGSSKPDATLFCCYDRMICWQYSPMRQLGACVGNRNSPKLTHGATRRLTVRI